MLNSLSTFTSVLHNDTFVSTWSNGILITKLMFENTKSILKWLSFFFFFNCMRSHYLPD